MRCTPIAVYSHLLSAEDLHKVVVADVSFTHCHQNVISSVYLYCYAIGRLIKYAGNAERATLAFE
jgi:ADP-ribosylglycohydrolase